ncbi:hypothetical protein A2130_00220 [Candidatus Woesebacteria bacterium GWC2_33_12]|uniref:DUF2335 domain-containing protein n=1 Tax=Candidatus Woesebacteria bacterium GW2011_GWB1_33_22 TaxID=1618566 RepID=A0A0G0C0T4_9BACT|nr:MAG: hypothetical protein UR29_C0010G0035 [Candidatus Woesebacteria bacterium GW2011_GWC2_33_12]KKP42060.1 MAG: hypothetical protein UR33_C0006G0044 [Candidatus Woesebacteria bacterium GW2011_GWA2_33_20]KKP44790.1 MAG: hypothetical protein UR35_C0006G0025 [Candidatus Woesebacteria bacterium GW2011_GWB1_33_22]KKP46609.1 MAG: hypothetical protein UR37_C0006G0059 [Microgenomates group bacterium GW2011_GWC1_33_28]KKP50522.1 MAG: hypothetical protein UR41_C0006G0025 [Candidatus Woesebacteria bact
MTKDTEILVGNETSSVDENTKQPGTGAFSKLSRELSETDLKNPAVGRMLLEKIDTLSSEKVELSGFRQKFYDADKRSAILDQQVQGENKFQILYSLCLTIGGAIFGIAFTTSGETKFVLILSGVVLLLVGSVLSFFINKK